MTVHNSTHVPLGYNLHQTICQSCPGSLSWWMLLRWSDSTEQQAEMSYSMEQSWFSGLLPNTPNEDGFQRDVCLLHYVCVHQKDIDPESEMSLWTCQHDGVCLPPEAVLKRHACIFYCCIWLPLNEMFVDSSRTKAPTYLPLDRLKNLALFAGESLGLNWKQGH